MNEWVWSIGGMLLTEAKIVLHSVTLFRVIIYVERDPAFTWKWLFISHIKVSKSLRFKWETSFALNSLYAF